MKSLSGKTQSSNKEKSAIRRKGLVKKLFSFTKKILPGLEDISKNKSSFTASAASGIIFILIFPRFDLSILAWICLVPFLISIKNKNIKTAFWLGIVFGFIGYYGSMFWINHIRKYNPLAVVGIPFIAVYFSVYIGTFAALNNLIEKSNNRFTFLLSAAIWTSLDYIRSLGTFGFPWNYLAHSQGNSIPLIQICDITGIFGVTFIIFIVNKFTANAFFYYKTNTLKRIPLEIAITSGLLIFTFTYGTFRMKSDFIDSTKSIEVALVQPRISQDIKLESYSSDKAEIRTNLQQQIEDDLFRMMEDFQQKTGKSHGEILLYILPETAFTSDSFMTDAKLHERLFNFAKKGGADIFFGADKIVFLNRNGEIINDESDYFGYGVYNSAWLVSHASGLQNDSYDKIHLLPFGEYLPYFDKIPYFQELIVQIGSFRQGKYIKVFDIGDFKFGGVICIESIYPNLVRQFVKTGAQFLTIITNDAWYDDTAGPYQHAQASIFRAIENRTWLIRCGNHGISGFVSPYGEWKSKLLLNDKKVLSQIIHPKNSSKTFYTKFGDLFSIVLIFVSLFSILRQIYLKPKTM